MEWEISYEPSCGAIVARIEGEVTSARADDLLRAVVAEADKRATGRILLDNRLATLGMSVLEMCERPRAMCAAGLDRSHRLAILFREWSADAVFLEVLLGRGAFIGQVFVDESAAMSWLAAGEKSTVAQRVALA